VANPSDFVSRYRLHVTSLLTELESLNAMRAQWDALDYSTTLPPEAFEGANGDLDKAEMTAAVASIEAINAFVAAGHATNLYELLI
jgi:hypothetical protein